MKGAAELAGGIRRGEDSALEELYRKISTGFWRGSLLNRFGPQSFEDAAHDVFVTVVQQLQRGDLRNPEHLFAYMSRICHLQWCNHITVKAGDRGEPLTIPIACGRPNPEQELAKGEEREFALHMLNSLQQRERDILNRFYLEEQPRDQICREMELTETDFRLLKSRAKARLGRLGKASLARLAGAAA